MLRTLAALACTALLPTTLLAQEEEEPQLSRSALRSLSKKAAEFLETRIEYDAALNEDSRKRLALQGKLKKARADFEEEWDKRSKKIDLLASLPDLRAIFETAWPAERMSGSGVLKLEDIPDTSVQYGLVVPRGYRNSNRYPLIFQIPSYAEVDGGRWERPGDHFKATFEDADDRVFAVPQMTRGEPFDQPYEVGSEPSWQAEAQRCTALLQPLNAVLSTMAVDRDKVFLDCGTGSCGFALRFAALFPERFAGLILRSPADPGEVRLGNLIGLDVLFLVDDDTRQTAETIAAKLEELEEGSTTIVDGKGDYPYRESADDIRAWVEEVERGLFRHHVVVEPNADLIRGAYWVSIGRMDPLAGRPPERRPRLEAKADPETNRVEVTTQGVSTFSLLLNDELVDLDEPVTFVVNGKEIEEKLVRDRDLLFSKLYQREDTRYLFTQAFNYQVK